MRTTAIVLAMVLICGSAGAQPAPATTPPVTESAAPSASASPEPDAPLPATGSDASAVPASGEQSTPSPAPVAEAAPSEAAQPTPAAPPPGSTPPKLKLEAQAELDPLPPGPRTFRRHDGFYLRTNFGFGLLWGDFDPGEPGEANLTASGSGIGFDVLVGGSPNPGFVIGGGLLGSWLFSAEFKQEGGPASDHTLGTGLLGVFVDGFPSDTGGWHLGGLVGLGGQTLTNDGVADETGGFGGAVWGGYDQWVSDDFSVGGLVRFMAMRSTGEKEDNEIRAGTATLSLMFTALYH